MSALLLGIDIGTSVIKSILFDAAGREIAGAARENVLLHPTPGMVEQNMTAVWQAAAETAAEAVVSVQGAADEIVAIGVTGQGDGTWLVDAEGRPVGNAVTWLDGRVGDLVEAAHTGGLSEQVFARTGTALNTSNQALQLRWLAEHEPDRLARAHAALRAKDWIFLCLTGQFATDESDASHTYFSVGTRALDPGLPGLLGIGQWTRLLPPIRAATENQAPLLADAALRLGLRPGTPVVAGPFDVAAADLGSGVFQPGNHGSTFGGNPLACAAGMETLDVIAADGLLENAERVGAAIREGFSSALDGQRGVVAVRGNGLMIGIELVGKARDAGVLLNVTAERVVRILPPLVFSLADGEELVRRVAPLIAGLLAG